MAYVDSETGELTSKPSEDQIKSFSSSMKAQRTSEQFVFTEEELPNGVIKVDLQGRYQKQLIATVDKEGRLTVSHGDVSAYNSFESDGVSDVISDGALDEASGAVSDDSKNK